MNQEINHEHRHEEGEGGHACLSRRRFLLFGVAGATLMALEGIPGLSQVAQAMVASYPSQKVGSLSALKAGEPQTFAYPYPDVQNVLVKLGAPAGGGVGKDKDKDIVAFNQMCTHMGGPLVGTYKGNHQVMGPCPLHLTTFDLTRHGMVVSGHATESLPQIVLEVKGDDIYATGVMGLVFGYADNTGGHA